MKHFENSWAIHKQFHTVYYHSFMECGWFFHTLFLCYWQYELDKTDCNNKKTWNTGCAHTSMHTNSCAYAHE